MTPTPRALDDAVAAATEGALIVFPTDTVYGIAARPDDARATAAVFAAKGRPSDLTLPVLAGDRATALEMGRFDAAAEALAAACWPGPVTIVVPRAGPSRSWELGGDRETVGLRVPAHPLALAVLGRTGPLAVTSANRSGRPEATTCDELMATFGDRVAVYLCEPEPLVGSASTVVDLGHGDPRIVRTGGAAGAVAAVLRGAGRPLLDSPPPA
jgi:L-threonylcarbamoyladenylate synthase